MLTILLLSQLVTSQIDVMSLNLGPIQQPKTVEVDGNPATQEWLVTTLFSTQTRLVRVSAAGVMCAGAPFALDTSWQVQRFSNGRDYLTRLVFPYFQLVDLAQYLPAGCA